MTSTSRLTVILAADVAGYARLMCADEEGTHERLRAIWSEVTDPRIDAHHGRIVKIMSDGLLVEFASVVDAVRCAVDIQREMKRRREAKSLADSIVLFRIGIHVGDIIIDDADIFGDGVNIAARLEGLAEPGGICISRIVRDQMHKLPYPLVDLGERRLKNIAWPVRVYALEPHAPLVKPHALLAATNHAHITAAKPILMSVVVSTGVLGLAMVVAGVALVWLGASGNSEIEILGATITTANVGTRCCVLWTCPVCIYVPSYDANLSPVRCSKMTVVCNILD